MGAQSGGFSGYRKPLAAIVVVFAAVVVWWAGYPWTKLQCMRWAVDRPATGGVQIAMQICGEEFAKPAKVAQAAPPPQATHRDSSLRQPDWDAIFGPVPGEKKQPNPDDYFGPRAFDRWVATLSHGQQRVKTWSEVESSAVFKALSAAEQEAARQQYFAEVVAPHVPKDELADAKAQFDQESLRSKPANHRQKQ